jgi:hypothetical protein
METAPLRSDFQQSNAVTGAKVLNGKQIVPL